MSDTRQPDHSLSHMLTQAVARSPGDYISIGELIAGIQTQALALLLILFALPNVLPSPPGTTAIFGAPLVLLTVQMALGRGVWLPQIILGRALPRGAFLALLTKAGPSFARIERLLRPRLLVLTGAGALRIWGAVMVVLSVMIMLPIPLANTAPSIAIILIAMGLLERDGLFVLAGLLAAVGAAVVVVTVYWTLITLALGQAAQWLGG
jgi:hypothetical protein